MIATLPRRAFLAGSGAVLLGAAPLPLRYESLFHIERNKNPWSRIGSSSPRMGAVKG